MSVELCLVRHGQSKWNAEGCTQGQHPSKENCLSVLGIEQAKALAKRLEPLEFDHIYSSDLPRTLQTARICYPDPDTAITQDTRLREIKRAALAGKTHFERTPEEVELLKFIKEDRFSRRPPDGENHQDVMERVKAWMTELPEEGRLLVFTHGGVIRAALALLIGYEHARVFELENTGITRLNLSKGKTRVICVNDRAHLSLDFSSQ